MDIRINKTFQQILAHYDKLNIDYNIYTTGGDKQEEQPKIIKVEDALGSRFYVLENPNDGDVIYKLKGELDEEDISDYLDDDGTVLYDWMRK